MFCHLNYNFDKTFLRSYFFKNFNKARHHKTEKSELRFWYKLFDCNNITDPIINDLNLQELNILPRFSFQLKNTRLYPHIDIDRIVAVNLNLMPEIATIHLNGIAHEYEAALIDVGSKLHSVEPVDNFRLVLKLAIRNPWEEIYSRLKSKNLLKTFHDSYESILRESDKHLVKL